MSHPLPFAEVLEVVLQLRPDQQEALLYIVRRSLGERGRARVEASVREANEEFASGGCRAVTPDEMMREILS